MLSPQEYLKNAILSNASDLFENFNESNIKVDLLSGNVKLINMVSSILVYCHFLFNNIIHILNI